VTGTKLIHVPYKGSGQYLPDVIAGHTDFVFDQLSTSITFIKSGKLRALGVTTLSRVGSMPELPTLAESGLPEFEASTTTGILFPAATPPAFVAKVNEALTKVLKVPATRERFVRIGADVVESSPGQFDRIMREEIAKWTKVVREANVKIE
ncbi:MAG: tripartite tricarboxylate transporter substrate-binding protein, partial [Sulfuricaulis sp.]|nr:tripartite tricarboxylate transporter substrate-binding protein [Sulfuricaulis sp.]